MKVSERVKALYPCQEALKYLSQYEDPKKAWDECRRGDWMLWILGKLSGEPKSEERKKLVLASCACARLALPYTKDERVLNCIKTAEKWARGEASFEDLQKVHAAAYAAAYAADDAAAAAAYAAADDDAAAAAAYAAAAAAAAAADAADDTRKETLSKCADIVRQFYPQVPSEE